MGSLESFLGLLDDCLPGWACLSAGSRGFFSSLKSRPPNFCFFPGSFLESWGIGGSKAVGGRDSETVRERNVFVVPGSWLELLTKTLMVLNSSAKLAYMGFSLALRGPVTPAVQGLGLEETGLAEECGRFIVQLLHARVSSMLGWLNGMPELTLLVSLGTPEERGSDL